MHTTTLAPVPARPVVPPDVVDDVRRREFLGILAAAGLLSACGEGATGEPPATDGSYPREVDHFDGTATIPARPQRVVCCSPLNELEALLSLGIAPVQVGVRSFSEPYTGGPTALWPWQEAALERLGATPERVNADEPADPEVVAGARPDLVLGLSYWLEARGQLEELAPVLDLSFGWRESLRCLGEVFDRADDAAAIIAETEARIASALDGLDLGAPTFAFAYPQGDGQVVVTVGAQNAAVDLFSRAGFRAPEELQSGVDEFGDITLSFEQLDRLGGLDLVIVTAYAEAEAERMFASPVWQNLPVVRDDRVFVIEQGAEAQALATFSPLSLDVVLPLVREAADVVLAPRG
jgi:iron complex transport system substrate-binding protein